MSYEQIFKDWAEKKEIEIPEEIIKPIAKLTKYKKVKPDKFFCCRSHTGKLCDFNEHDLFCNAIIDKITGKSILEICKNENVVFRKIK